MRKFKLTKIMSLALIGGGNLGGVIFGSFPLMLTSCKKEDNSKTFEDVGIKVDLSGLSNKTLQDWIGGFVTVTADTTTDYTPLSNFDMGFIFGVGKFQNASGSKYVSALGSWFALANCNITFLCQGTALGVGTYNVWFPLSCGYYDTSNAYHQIASETFFESNVVVLAS